MYVTSPFVDKVSDGTFSVRVAREDSQDFRYSTRTLSARSSLFCEGDEATQMYQVVSGVVRSTKLLADGRRQVVAFGYPGDIVGLSADTLYHHDCDAVCDTELRIIPLSELTNDGDLLSSIMRCAAAEVSGMHDHFIMLGRKCAQEKLASFLVTLMNRVGKCENNCEADLSTDPCGSVCFDLPMSRADIADFLGLSTETVSRTFTNLRNAKIIVLPQSHRVCVTCPNRLLDIAERSE